MLCGRVLKDRKTRTRIVRRWAIVLISLFFTARFNAAEVAATSRSQSDLPAAAGDIRELTGAHTRIVWIQDLSKDRNDVFSKNSELRLMGFDSEEERPRIILPTKEERQAGRKRGNFCKPLITPDGKRVVFTDRTDGNVCVTNWDGSGVRKVTPGFAADVWAEPETGRVWVYFQAKIDVKESPIYRCLLDNPGEKELIWDKTAAETDNFQISRDGTHASGLFPWSDGGVAQLPNASWKKKGEGCWTSLAPDNSYLFWIFDGPHRNVYLSADGREGNWMVNINDAPEIEGWEVYHPRWSNHPRFMTMTGPYRVGEMGGNLIDAGGDSVGIYLGRFNDEFTAIEKWAHVALGTGGNFYPDTWIEGGEDVNIPTSVGENLTQPMASGGGDDQSIGAWPGRHDGLVFLWENASKTNEVVNASGEVARTCSADLRGLARLASHHEAHVAGGSLAARDADDALLEECRKSNEFSIEALLAFKGRRAGPARIASFSSGAEERNFTLAQEGDELMLSVRTAETDANGSFPGISLGKLSTDGQPQHVIVTFSPGRARLFLNGKLIGESAAFEGDFSNWTAQRLVFGAEWDGTCNWSGRMEGLAVYSRALSAEEARLQFLRSAARIKDRQQPEWFKVKATLLSRTPTPDPQSIAPYKRALAVYEYQVDEVLNGSVKAGKILVAHWAVMDGAVLKSLDERVEGRPYTLTLNRFSDNPQLQSERLVNEIDDWEPEQYFDVGRIEP